MDHSFPRNSYLFGGLDRGVKGGGNFGVESMYESLWMGIGLDGYHISSATGGRRLGFGFRGQEGEEKLCS